MQDNQITLRGYVTAEPKYWQTTPTQTPVAEIRIGSTPRRLNRATGEWQDGDTTYYSVKCWRRLAVNVASSLRKGDMVIVRGKFTSRQWLDDQQRPRVRIEVEADTVGHDLSFGWAHFIRGVQAPQNQWRHGASGEDANEEQEPRDVAAVGTPGGGEPDHDHGGYGASGLAGSLADDLASDYPATAAEDYPAIAADEGAADAGDPVMTVAELDALADLSGAAAEVAAAR